MCNASQKTKTSEKYRKFAFSSILHLVEHAIPDGIAFLMHVVGREIESRVGVDGSTTLLQNLHLLLLVGGGSSSRRRSSSGSGSGSGSSSWRRGGGHGIVLPPATLWLLRGLVVLVVVSSRSAFLGGEVISEK